MYRQRDSGRGRRIILNSIIPIKMDGTLYRFLKEEYLPLADLLLSAECRVNELDLYEAQRLDHRARLIGLKRSEDTFARLEAAKRNGRDYLKRELERIISKMLEGSGTDVIYSELHDAFIVCENKASCIVDWRGFKKEIRIIEPEKRMRWVGLQNKADLYFKTFYNLKYLEMGSTDHLTEEEKEILNLTDSLNNKSCLMENIVGSGRHELLEAGVDAVDFAETAIHEMVHAINMGWPKGKFTLYTEQKKEETIREIDECTARLIEIVDGHAYIATARLITSAIVLEKSNLTQKAAILGVNSMYRALNGATENDCTPMLKRVSTLSKLNQAELRSIAERAMKNIYLETCGTWPFE